MTVMGCLAEYEYVRFVSQTSRLRKIQNPSISIPNSNQTDSTLTSNHAEGSKQLSVSYSTHQDTSTMFYNRHFCTWIFLQTIVTASVSGFQSVPSKGTSTRQRSNIRDDLLVLRGGESGVQSDEETLIKFYTLKGGMCPYAARTWITLLELGLPFETIEITQEDKNGW